LNAGEKDTVAQMGDWIAGLAGMAVNLKEFYIWFRYKAIFSFLRSAGM